MTDMTDPDTAWAPERIWLLRDADGGPGHHLWCQDPDPAGDGTESIAYVRLDATARPHDASFVTRATHDKLVTAYDEVARRVVELEAASREVQTIAANHSEAHVESARQAAAEGDRRGDQHQMAMANNWAVVDAKMRAALRPAEEPR